MFFRRANLNETVRWCQRFFNRTLRTAGFPDRRTVGGDRARLRCFVVSRHGGPAWRRARVGRRAASEANPRHKAMGRPPPAEVPTMTVTLSPAPVWRDTPKV